MERKLELLNFKLKIISLIKFILFRSRRKRDVVGDLICTRELTKDGRTRISLSTSALELDIHYPPWKFEFELGREIIRAVFTSDPELMSDRSYCYRKSP